MDTDFHFHEWAFLAQADAQAFERRRTALIEEFLRRSGHHRPLLESLQYEIDQQRRAAATPDEAVVAISSMMCSSFCSLIGEIGGLRRELKRLRDLSAPLVGESTAEQREAPATEPVKAQSDCTSLTR